LGGIRPQKGKMKGEPSTGVFTFSEGGGNCANTRWSITPRPFQGRGVANVYLEWMWGRPREGSINPNALIPPQWGGATRLVGGHKPTTSPETSNKLIAQYSNWMKKRKLDISRAGRRPRSNGANAECCRGKGDKCRREIFTKTLLNI